MSVMSSPAGGAIQPPPYPIYQFTVDDYHRLIKEGILKEDDRVELLEGWIVPKMTHNPLHDMIIDLAQDALRARLPAGWRLRIQSAITTGDSEPEPDLAIVAGPGERYRSKHPGPKEIALLIEVADSTLASDRKDKARLYARAGIAIYWIFNLIDFQVEVYSDPTGPDASPAYRQRQEFARGSSVPLVIGSHQVGFIPVNELLP